MRRVFLIFVFVCLASVGLVNPVPRVRAQNSASNLLDIINALRANRGLPPYQIDANLMASAQSQSEYQASIGKTSHTRADGSTPATLGFIENIMGGYHLTAQAAVNTWQADGPHLDTLVGISDGFAGSGMAEQDGVIYYTLDVRRAPGAESIAPAGGSIASGTGSTDATQPVDPQVILSVQTSAPEPDGSILHEVQPGQSAWSIAMAYNVKIADLVMLNRLAATPVLFAGQKLVIRAAFTPTISPTITKTPKPPTRTPTLTRTVRPPTATATVVPTATATPFSLLDALPSIDFIDRRFLGIGMIVICGAGLAFVLASSFRKK